MMGAGARRHYVRLYTTIETPDGEGGYTTTQVALSPSSAWVSITPATTRELERVTANTVQSMATHIVSMPHRSDVTTKTRIVYGSRTLAVTGVANPEERNRETVCVCAEVVT